MCEACETCGETNDGGEWYCGRYTCARCVKAQIAAEDAPGDWIEEAKIREKEQHDDRLDDKAERGSWSDWRNVTDRRTDGK
jgi:hypothetical protein